MDVIYELRVGLGGADCNSKKAVGGAFNIK